jgi:hypothetical protein
MPKTLLLMNSIRSYADGLAAIVNADTASQVTTQVSATIASVKSLATTVAKLGGPDSTSLVKLGDYATPVGNLFSWGAGQYIAKLQLEGLRRATADARPVLSGAAELFETISNEASFPTRALLAEEVRQRTDALRTNLNQRNVEELAASAARYDRVLLGGPAPVFRQLRQSHDALIGKIQDENVTLAEVIERIQAFAAEAQKLAAVVKEIEAIGKKKAEG